MQNDNISHNEGPIRPNITKGKKSVWGEFFINNSLYIFMTLAIVIIAIANPRFLSASSIINIVSLSAANLPIALGIAGCIILSGTDLSAGRIVGVVACVAASLLQSGGYANKMFPDLATMPVYLVILIILAIGGLKEKLLAAKSAGVKTVFVPEKNMRDVEEISTEITEGLEIIPVSHMKDVLGKALVCED